MYSLGHNRQESGKLGHRKLYFKQRDKQNALPIFMIKQILRVYLINVRYPKVNVVLMKSKA